MHNSSDTDQLWPAVSGTPVEHAILACMGELDALAAEYLAEVRQLSGYPASAITDEEIVDTATASLELLLRLIGDLPVTQDLRIVSTETGRKRARQGIPIDSLLRAVRMDFRLIWRALRGMCHPSRSCNSPSRWCRSGTPSRCTRPTSTRDIWPSSP